MEKWESYEQVAAYLLDQFAKEFGPERVEGKQELLGQRSGTTWEIDGKGVRQGDSGFVIVECRRYTTSRQNQEKIGSLAYRILDIGAAGGIVVSPLGLQEGAEKVAAAENILSVQLDPNCNRFEYMLSFLNRVMVGVHDRVATKDEVLVQVILNREAQDSPTVKDEVSVVVWRAAKRNE
jgi:hypothetical protein